jgi:transposase
MGTTAGTAARKYQHHSGAFKREVVEASLKPGVSVARLALDYGINANQIWAWRKLYREGSLHEGTPPALVAVDIVQTPTVAASGEAARDGCLEIIIGRAQLRVTGRADVEVLKTALTALLA